MAKTQEIVKNIEQSIDKIKNKEHKIVFMVPDTKGNGRACVSVIYRQAMALNEAGYTVALLLEKKDSIKASVWLGDEYEKLTHYTIEENNMVMGGHDFIVIPEIYGSVLEQIEKLPMEKILFIQSYDYFLEPYAPGTSFMDKGVSNTLTTSNTLSTMLDDTLRYTNTKVIPVGIPEWFSPTDNLVKPTVGIHCRDAKKAAKIIKTFYLKYPIYRFISFKDMHSMTEKDFAANLKDCCLSVWVDDESSFGTFPVESMKCNVPVVGKIPNIIPEWMTDDNGIWVYDEHQIVDLISAYIKNWLEDSVPENLQNVSESMKDKYTMTEFVDTTTKVFEEFFNERIEKLEKIKEDYIKTEEENA